jgi:NAD(P)-dependent dehydrogenase (short-subunit alcohol dehydrogenase family)
MTLPLTNKTALVTGGSRSIGAAIVKKLSDDGAAVAFTYAGSVEKANELVRRVGEKLPITSGVPYHSIMDDRGRGDTPNSSDGVVPYWSSYLDGAQSELIVNSDHDAPMESGRDSRS